MIVLATDFGLAGPYVGQMRAVLTAQAPGVPVIDLFADLPPFNARVASYLLAAYCQTPFPQGSVFLCVVDPGVGTERNPIVVEANGRYFVGPDNGLFEMVLRRAEAARTWVIEWRPETLSDSFHGRDLFAPVAAVLARGAELPAPGLREVSSDGVFRPAWPDDLDEIVYLDHYGNAMTGVRGDKVPPRARLRVGKKVIERARTFGCVGAHEPLWYINSNGLVEIAVNGGSAAESLGLAVGEAVHVEESG